MNWISVEGKKPSNKCACDVLLLTAKGDLEEGTAIYYKHLQGFVLPATTANRCGTTRHVAYWRKQANKD